MKIKLILFYGPGFGSGKSTLSRLIHDVLQQRGVKAKYVAESDVFHLDAFAPYVEEVKKKSPSNVEVLLSSCEHFIDACSQSNQVYIVDSTLPYSQGNTMDKMLVVVTFLAVLTVTGCLPGDSAATHEKPARFLSGIWHGWLCWLSLIIGVFNDNIRIYETVNSGWWYDLGYLLGAGAIGSSGFVINQRIR